MINSSVFDIDHLQVYSAFIMGSGIEEQNKEVRECRRQVRNPARVPISATTAARR
jgi:hypothetical protein